MSDSANIINQFEAVVDKNPNKFAVVSGDGVTYRELYDKANQIALMLRDIEIEEGCFIAVLLSPGLSFVATLLGILKENCVYVPISSQYPPDRIKFILDDANVRLIISQDSLLGKIPLESYVGEIINLDKVSNEEERVSLEKKVRRSCARPLAYMIYTSGSTGNPKGVLIDQASVINLVKNTNYITISESDSVAQLSNISFDAATFEIWGALLNGATLCILPDFKIMLDCELFEKFLLENNVTIAFVTTALFNQFSLKNPKLFRTLRCLLFGGEKSDPKAVNRIFSSTKNDGLMLIHMYGPTENTVFTTFHIINNLHVRYDSVPIGKPITGSKVHVLNDNLDELKVGEIGELYISGTGLAAGYFNREEKIRDQFFMHKVCDHHFIRLYRTGDKVKKLSGGDLLFIDRADNQIKLRGYRVELSEIEKRLLEHVAINQAIVCLENDRYFRKRLVAYCVKECNVEVDHSEIKFFLKKVLPEYMCPSKIIFRKSLPITHNGKINKASLNDCAR